jgi:hypothetical protein
MMRFNILVVPYMLARGERVPLAGSDPARFQQLVHRVRDQMQFAEQLGYSGFCMTEQHLQIEGIETTTSPLFWDLFVAQHTKTMRVGQLGMNPDGSQSGAAGGEYRHARPSDGRAGLRRLLAR